MGAIISRIQERAVIQAQIFRHVPFETYSYGFPAKDYPPQKILDSSFIENIWIPNQRELSDEKCAALIKEKLIRNSNYPENCEIYVTCESDYEGRKSCTVYNLSKVINQTNFEKIFKDAEYFEHKCITSVNLRNILTIPQEDIRCSTLDKILEEKVNNSLINKSKKLNGYYVHVDCYNIDRKNNKMCNLYILKNTAVEAMIRDKFKPTPTPTPKIETAIKEISKTQAFSAGTVTGIIVTIIIGIFGNK